MTATTRTAAAAARITTAAAEWRRISPKLHALAARADALVLEAMGIDVEPETQSPAPVSPPAPAATPQDTVSPLAAELLAAFAGDELAQAKAIRHALDANPAWRTHAPQLLGSDVDYSDAKTRDKALRLVCQKAGVKAPKATQPVKTPPAPVAPKAKTPPLGIDPTAIAAAAIAAGTLGALGTAVKQLGLKADAKDGKEMRLALQAVLDGKAPAPVATTPPAPVPQTAAKTAGPAKPAPVAKKPDAPKADAKPATGGLAAYRQLQARCKVLGLSPKGKAEQLTVRIRLAEQELATKRECPAPTTQPEAVQLSVPTAKAELVKRFLALDVATMTQLLELADAGK